MPEAMPGLEGAERSRGMLLAAPHSAGTQQLLRMQPSLRCLLQGADQALGRGDLAAADPAPAGLREAVSSPGGMQSKAQRRRLGGRPGGYGSSGAGGGVFPLALGTSRFAGRGVSSDLQRAHSSPAPLPGSPGLSGAGGAAGSELSAGQGHPRSAEPRPSCEPASGTCIPPAPSAASAAPGSAGSKAPPERRK